MSNYTPKFLIATLSIFSCMFAGCVSACDKINSDEPQISKPDSDPSISEITPADNLYEVILPEGIPSQTKMYTGFFVSFNKDNRTPNYVSWELLSSETYGTANRNNYDFWRDTEIEGCPTKDYQFSTYGYQRGHMCPAADQKWSEVAMKDCMVMANMCPQLGDLNEKAWEKLEEKERQWAKRDGAIWIVAGPIYDESNDNLRIGANDVRVPGAFFKAFLYYNGKDSRAIAFIYPNELAPGNMQDYAMSIDDLEKETGYDFFSYLPDDIENAVEAEFSFTEWNK